MIKLTIRARIEILMATAQQDVHSVVDVDDVGACSGRAVTGACERELQVTAKVCSPVPWYLARAHRLYESHDKVHVKFPISMRREEKCRQRHSER